MRDFDTWIQQEFGQHKDSYADEFELARAAWNASVNELRKEVLQMNTYFTETMHSPYDAKTIDREQVLNRIEEIETDG